MTAQIVGFLSRAELGMRAPRSVSHNVNPEKGGVAGHYGGGAIAAAEPDSDHAECIRIWLAWQNDHMNRRRFVDIAYTGGYCNHGYAFAGRGAGVRTGANGTNIGNQIYLAVVWIGGGNQTPTQLAFDAFDWWIVQLRKSGAGTKVKPHKFFKATGCPGDAIEDHCASRDGKGVSEDTQPMPTPTPTPTPRPNNVVERIQYHHEVTNDGKWGPNTDSRVMFMRRFSRAYRGWPANIASRFVDSELEMAQRVVDTPDDGIIGPNSMRALDTWIKQMQSIMGVKSDGHWGPKTDGRLLTLRRRYRGNY